MRRRQHRSPEEKAFYAMGVDGGQGVFSRSNPWEAGLAVAGWVGKLKELYRRGEINDLRHVYEELLRQGIRIDIRTHQGSWKKFNVAAR